MTDIPFNPRALSIEEEARQLYDDTKIVYRFLYNRMSQLNINNRQDRIIYQECAQLYSIVMMVLVFLRAYKDTKVRYSKIMKAIKGRDPRKANIDDRFDCLTAIMPSSREPTYSYASEARACTIEDIRYRGAILHYLASIRIAFINERMRIADRESETYKRCLEVYTVANGLKAALGSCSDKSYSYETGMNVLFEDDKVEPLVTA